MGGSPFRQVVFNPRESVLSTDINRAQQLSSKALQDEMMNSQEPASGAPINTLTKIPTMAGVATTFAVAMGVGEALVYAPTGVGSNDSVYKVVQWAGQNLTFAAPDPTNPRIDLIVVTPGTSLSDNSVRNILLNAVTRAFSPASVPKTQSPIVVPVVVTGVAGATPAPPAVPANAFAVWEVFVPAAAADATTFLFTPRLFRPAGYPFVGKPGFKPQCGIFRGCELTYVSTFEAIGSTDNAVLIDGEVIEFGALSDLGNNDTLNNPFAAPAPAGNDKPFYIYAVGGRNLPSATGASPISLVASLTAPDPKTARPLSPIGAPRGVTSSAVFIGIGFVRKNTSNRQICRMVGDFVWFDSPLAADGSFETQAGIATGDNAVTLASAPAVSDEVILSMRPNTGGSAAGFYSARLPSMNAASDWLWALNQPISEGDSRVGNARLPITRGAGPHLNVIISGAANSITVGALAYNMNLRHI